MSKFALGLPGGEHGTSLVVTKQQQKQLEAFVAPNKAGFFNFGTAGFTVLDDIAVAMAQQIPFTQATQDCLDAVKATPYWCVRFALPLSLSCANCVGADALAGLHDGAAVQEHGAVHVVGHDVQVHCVNACVGECVGAGAYSLSAEVSSPISFVRPFVLFKCYNRVKERRAAAPPARNAARRAERSSCSPATSLNREETLPLMVSALSLLKNADAPSRGAPVNTRLVTTTAFCAVDASCPAIARAL